MDDSLIIISAIFVAYLLDLLLGDPIWLPHPIVAFGKSISFFEKRLNKGNKKVFKGFFAVFILVCITYFFFFLIFYLAEIINIWLYASLTCLFFFYGIANKTLIKESREVFIVLKKKGLEAGRKQISRIVGRDTSQLSEQQIKTATLETLSENLSDGVVAPIFYYLIGGIPAMMCYKMINTLDSMIGYKSERFREFGLVAAKLDDLANYIPARLTAILMSIVSLSFRSIHYIHKYGKAHSSPNAGYPEAALAGILNCRFGGPSNYFGKQVDKPYIGSNAREITNKDIKIAIRVNHLVCLIMVFAVCLKHIL